MAKRSTKTLYPNPVICGFFSGGEQVRMSFAQQRGKPWRFNAMVAMIKQIIGNERARAAQPDWPATYWHNNYTIPTGPPAEDLLCYFVEWNGDIYRDEPQPSPQQVRAAKRAARMRERDPLRKRVVPFVVKQKASKTPRKRPTAAKGKRAA